MKIALDRESSEPVYLQIRNRISRLIETGGVKPGDRLPSIRELARSSQVNKLTVIEAYSVLEADGLIHARQGAGYFINQQLSTQPKTESTFAPTQEVIIPEKGMNSFLDIRNAALQAQAQKDFINLSSGFPPASGMDDLQRIARRAVKESIDDLFRQNHPQGQPKLRGQIAQLLVQHGLEISPENLIVTNGSMQALALLAQQYIQPGDWVIVEAPTFHGFLSILEQAGARAIGIPMTAEGMNLQLLEQYLQSHQPKLIYTISSLHNPTGITTSLSHRRQLLALADQYNCWVVEDNAYEWLAFEPTPPPIKALDQCDRAIYLGTFSKTLMPGLRVGYMVVTGKDYQPLVERKLLHDMHVSVVSQAIISEYLATGHYRRRLNHLRTINQQNRNVMLQALEQHFPADASWTIPNGGLFLWVHLPKTVAMPTLCRKAASEKVLISSGSAFFADQQGYPALRLNFAQPLEDIQRGIEILGRLIGEGE
ncbi:MAG: PLP-dependent aminotransferase family protein [Leptolyngbyaceae cyanobacterium MO_188.B28]|nr:PLP-dependent aminotransferase family protein [Leptolyngbyaceae cyanobacterium MO_188.B28]